MKQIRDMHIVEVFALGTVNEMMRFIREEYNTPDFNVKVRLDFNPRRNRSWGGKRNGQNFISLAMTYLKTIQENHMAASFFEYASFANDPVIGSLHNVTWKKALAALIAHEIAHAAQYSEATTSVMAAHNLNNSHVPAHGLVWKIIYKTLRTKYVNTL